MSTRPKIPAMRTVTADSSPRSGCLADRLHRHPWRPHGVVEDLGDGPLLRSHPHDDADDDQRPGRHPRALPPRPPPSGTSLATPRAPLPSPPVSATGQQLVDLVGWRLDSTRPRWPVMATLLPALTQQRRIHVIAKHVCRHFDPVEDAVRQGSSVADRSTPAARRPSAMSTRWKMSWRRTVSPSIPWSSVIEVTTRPPPGQPLELHEQTDGQNDLLANGSLRQFDPAHHHHGLQTAQELTWRVGVDGGHRSGVTGVHGLEHVERLRATAFSDDDPVRVACAASCAPGRGCGSLPSPRRWPAGSRASRRARPGSGVQPTPQW